MSGPLADDSSSASHVKRTYHFANGKRVKAPNTDTARAARWAVIRLAWLARSEAVRAPSPERRAAGALLGQLLGESSKLSDTTNKLGPRVTGGDPVAVAASQLLAELNGQLAEAA